MFDWVNIEWPGARGILEILVLAVVFYYLLRFIRGTRGAQVLSGLAVLLAVLMGMTWLFNLDTLNWLLQRLSVYVAVALLIIFQPEIRRALAELGRRHVFTATQGERPLVDTIVKACLQLAEQKIGALIAVEREVSVGAVVDTGTRLDSAVSADLLTTIFFPKTPLHDGGVIIKGDRVAAAACLFPLSQKEELSRQLGTRHRAAIGLTEETDAVVVVISEETGTISVAFHGRLRRGFDEEHLRRVLGSLLGRRRAKGDKTATWAATRWLRGGWAKIQPIHGMNGEDHGK